MYPADLLLEQVESLLSIPGRRLEDPFACDCIVQMTSIAPRANVGGNGHPVQTQHEEVVNVLTYHKQN
jgi:hypothetical protein